jgi:hypothetical protein
VHARRRVLQQLAQRGVKGGRRFHHWISQGKIEDVLLAILLLRRMPSSNMPRIHDALSIVLDFLRNWHRCPLLASIQ